MSAVCNIFGLFHYVDAIMSVQAAQFSQCYHLHCILLHQKIFIPPAPHNLETVQIPTPKPYIFVFLMIRQIQTLTGDPHRCISPSHPLHFIIGLISQKPFISPSLNYIYTMFCVPYDMMHPMTLTGDPPGGMPHPFHFIYGLISQKPFKFLPLNHIYLCPL